MVPKAQRSAPWRRNSSSSSTCSWRSVAPGSDQPLHRGEAGRGRGHGAPHALQLDLVLGPLRLQEPLLHLGGEVGVRAHAGQRHAQHGHAASAPLVEPAVELRERRALGVRAALPDPLVLGHVGHEVGPARLRVERDHPAHALAVGEVDVLGVGEERVGLVLPARDGDGVPRADEHDPVGEAPGAGDALAAAVEVTGHAGSSHGTAGARRRCGGPGPAGRAIVRRQPTAGGRPASTAVASPTEAAPGPPRGRERDHGHPQGRRRGAGVGRALPRARGRAAGAGAGRAGRDPRRPAGRAARAGRAVRRRAARPRPGAAARGDPLAAPALLRLLRQHRLRAGHPGRAARRGAQPGRASCGAPARR